MNRIVKTNMVYNTVMLLQHSDLKLVESLLKVQKKMRTTSAHMKLTHDVCGEMERNVIHIHIALILTRFQMNRNQ